MDGPVYPSRLERAGVGYDLPEPSERDRINEIIFQELVKGVLRTDSRAEVRVIITRLTSWATRISARRAHGVHGVSRVSH
jgi:aspartate/glutamate racemase